MAIRDVGLQEAREFLIHLQSRTQVHAQNANTPTQERHLSAHLINSTAGARRAPFNRLKQEGYTGTHRLQEMKVPPGAEADGGSPEQGGDGPDPG